MLAQLKKGWSCITKVMGSSGEAPLGVILKAKDGPGVLAY